MACILRNWFVFFVTDGAKEVQRRKRPAGREVFFMLETTVEKTRQCQICREAYRPTSNNQKFCAACRAAIFHTQKGYETEKRPACAACGKLFFLREDGIMLCKQCLKKRMEKIVRYDRKLLMANNTRKETAVEFAALFAITPDEAAQLMADIKPPEKRPGQLPRVRRREMNLWHAFYASSPTAQ